MHFVSEKQRKYKRNEDKGNENQIDSRNLPVFQYSLFTV